MKLQLIGIFITITLLIIGVIYTIKPKTLIKPDGSLSTSKVIVYSIVAAVFATLVTLPLYYKPTTSICACG